MSDRTITHDDFGLERVFWAPPDRVFSAFADTQSRRAWFAPPAEWGTPQHELDFRVGGHELNRAAPAGGPVRIFDAVFYDIVPNSRIVYAYEMFRDDVRISVSLATVEFLPEEDDGTHLIMTESGAYLDGYDKPDWREEGTNNLLDALAVFVDGSAR